MKWRKIQGILREHPYLIDDAACCSLTEAKNQLQASGYPSFEDMIAKAKARASLPPKAWAPVDIAMAKKARRAQRLETIESMGNTIRRHRRLAIAAVCILLILSFFTFVPAGRTLASSFFHMVFELFDGWALTRNTDPSQPEVFFEVPENPGTAVEQPEDTLQERDFVSFDEFAKETGRNPSTLQGDWLSLHSIELIDDTDIGFILTSTYYTKDSQEVMVRQSWGNIPSRVIDLENKTYFQKVNGDITFECFIDNNEGDILGNAVLNGSLLEIGAEKGVDIDQLIQSIVIAE